MSNSGSVIQKISETIGARILNIKIRVISES